ncbi:hypothetical protein DXT90_08705 [Agrobacterium tumefaciens]|nr:hypothetical protein [Agrobacterium tumefaciens]
MDAPWISADMSSHDAERNAAQANRSRQFRQSEWTAKAMCVLLSARRFTFWIYASCFSKIESDFQADAVVNTSSSCDSELDPTRMQIPIASWFSSSPFCGVEHQDHLLSEPK